MDLKTFVEQALADIIQGVSDAQTYLGNNGKYINPELSTQQGTLEEQKKLFPSRGNWSNHRIRYCRNSH